MKHARIAWAGAIHEAVESDGELLLTRSPWAGKRLKFDEVVWLPPLAPVPQARTILALGLNYADHAKELAFKAPEEPLVFVGEMGADGVIDGKLPNGEEYGWYKRRGTKDTKFKGRKV